MKRVIAGIAAVLLCWGIAAPAVYGESPGDISAQSAVLIEAYSGRVLYEKNADEKRSMASTTKIMTALLAIESERLDEVVEVTQEMVQVEGSSIYLKPGDKLTLRSVVYGLLLESGNDAANVIALTLAGSQERFAEMMNERAAQLGMKNTNFVTPSGLDDEEHYTTAYDMALLGSVAMRNDEFAAIASQKSATVEFIEPARKRTFYNHNRLLLELDGCNGVKTGFTKKSGRCLVSSCERDEILLIAVTLNAPNDWSDHKKMMEYGFQSVERVSFHSDALGLWLPLVGAGETQWLPVKEGMGVSAVIPKGRANDIRMKIEVQPFLYAPVQEDQVVGRIAYSLDEIEVAEIPLLAQESVAFVYRERNFFEKIVEFFRGLF